MLEFQKGDRAAFDKLMVKFYPRVLNFIYRFVGRREIAEDLTQDVFLKVFNQPQQYQPQAKLQTWLFTIARNVSLNELRKNKFIGFSLNQTAPTQEGELQTQISDPHAVNPSHAILQQEKVSLIKQAIAQLPENQRTAVILRRYEDFSYEEIAKTLNVSVKAVKSLLSRAKENLKKQLKDFIKY